MTSTQLILLLGPGGVGKTTCSASLACALATQNKKVLVLTVDPAKRLAQALGFSQLESSLQTVTHHQIKGSLQATWLNHNNPLEQLVTRHISNPTNLKKLMNHRFFKIVEHQLGGLNDYLSIESIINYYQMGVYDYIVVDTPPYQQALDFFNSPQELIKFFDQSILNQFTQPTTTDDSSNHFLKKRLQQVTSFGKEKLTNTFKNLIGKEFFLELSEFLKAMQPLHSQFITQSHLINKLLSSASFFFVSTPENHSLDMSLELFKKTHLQFQKGSKSFIINKCYQSSSPLQNLSKHSKLIELINESITKQNTILHSLSQINEIKSVTQLSRRYEKNLKLESLLQIGQTIKTHGFKS